MTGQASDDAAGDSALYVITLSTATLPMMLRVPFVHELEGFSVFRSRTIEDGRERYRLYLGYFDSPARAHEALAVVRQHYPSAWISCAPRNQLGSLDDTMNTAFRTLRRATARVVTRPEPAPALTPVAAPAPTTQPAAQRFVVQLDSAPVPLPSAAIPALPILRAYHLYRARMARVDGPVHLLRLGFFKEVHAAQTVAEFVRSSFPRAQVLPVSQREFLRTIELIVGASRAATETAPTHAASPAAAAEPADTAPLVRSRDQLIAILGANDLSLDESVPGGAAPAEDDRDPPPHPPARSIRSW
jgi:sporulation related protein